MCQELKRTQCSAMILIKPNLGSFSNDEGGGADDAL